MKRNNIFMEVCYFYLCILKPCRSAETFWEGEKKGNKAIAWRVQFLPRSPFVPRRLYGGFCNEVRLLSRGKKSLSCAPWINGKAKSAYSLALLADRSICFHTWKKVRTRRVSYEWGWWRENIWSYMWVHISASRSLIFYSFWNCHTPYSMLGKESNEWHPTRALGFLPNLNQSLIILFHF